MRRGRVSIPLFAVLAVLAWAASCGDGATAPPPRPPPDPPRPTTVTVSPATSQLTALGETVQLTASVRDQNGQAMAGATVTWASSDAAVATIDASGLVTAVGNGTATITAAAGSASGMAVVTVMQTADSVVVEPDEATLAVLGDTVRLAARAFDANGYELTDAQFSWSSSDASVATVDGSGLVTAVGNGTATITASAGSASATAEITVATSSDSPDRRTLETLYETTLGADWTNATNWLGSAPVGEWHGVEADASGRVIGLALSRNNLTGRIPPEVGDLDRLQYLHVDHNTLTGPLPPELAGATGLTSLRISDNTLSGPLPRSLLDLSLTEFRYADTGLCVPPYERFRDWLSGIASHAGTGAECGQLTDREILVRLYEATDGPNWNNNTNWLTETPLNQWYGVTTDAGGRVQRLDLGFNGLHGVVPLELGGLSHLQHLELVTDDRGLTGPIPPELGQLRQLRYLSLAHNGLVGPIPPEISNVSSLRYLALENNHLTGAIPRDLGQLTQLESLSLQLNTLSGELPPELGNLTGLRYLGLHRNLLLGPVPASLLRLDLRRFYFEDNLGLCAPGTTRFVSWLGRIDDTKGGYCNAGDAAVLERLHESAGGTGWTRSDGWLAGQPLDGWYGVVTDSLGYVQELDLRRNGLSGTLPSTLGDLSRLTTLRIGGNTLSGPLPLSLTQVTLRALHYANTSLCAPVDGGFQEWLNTVSSHEGSGLECEARDDRAVLESLYRALGGPNWNRSTGWLTDAALGDWHGVGVDGAGRVVELRLVSNNLSGRIPVELGNLSRLRELDLAANALVGSIPAAIGNLSQLEELRLTFNPLTGEIPPEIGRLTNLRRLNLASTDGLGGSIPAELGTHVPV
ncbi:MAG: Ig-like domain-containing protein [Gemmatimonadota bacterium]|nr:Ig-like domain-containing protein [Gemmatimonadota bacterium]